EGGEQLVAHLHAGHQPSRPELGELSPQKPWQAGGGPVGGDHAVGHLLVEVLVAHVVSLPRARARLLLGRPGRLKGEAQGDAQAGPLPGSRATMTPSHGARPSSPCTRSPSRPGAVPSRTLPLSPGMTAASSDRLRATATLSPRRQAHTPSGAGRER